jgi:hypothetical protein
MLPTMVKLPLNDGEVRALHDLLTDVTRQPNPFPLSPKSFAHRTVLEKIQDVLEEDARSNATQIKPPKRNR